MMVLEAKHLKEIKLSDARSELSLTQFRLHELSGVSTKVISNAERGIPIRRLTAHALLRALNKERKRQGIEDRLSISDLSWKISGDEEGGE